jgi:DNA-binding SARP family transcriptional activator/tetratricopeptide (TPR) repeat protein
VDFHLLGPVELDTGGNPVDLGTPRERHVLAALAVDAGRPVPVGTIIDRVWGPDAPPGARATLRVYLAHLRKVLGKASTDSDRPAAVLRRPGGYLLDVEADRVDLHRFRRLINQASDPGCTDDQQAALLRQALTLRRGEPLADLSGGWVERVRMAWSQEYLDAALAWARATLNTGAGGSTIGLLTELADEHDLNESLAAALMRALHAAGRSAEALKRYADMQARLDNDLGAHPDSELQAVHQQILRAGPATPAHPAGAPAASILPAQLPTDPAGFAGRTRYLDQLDSLLPEADTPGGKAIVITAINGTAGVGKTALAVHWAHRIRHRFPDGQLYVNLRGFDPTEQVMDPATAVRGFLDAFGVPPQRIPADLDAQAGLYRSLLASRQMLIVLDNAHDSAQVRPLLPGSPGCLVVVTSRNQLTSLIAATGAHPLTLDLLTHHEARDLLTRRLGADRIAAEPDAVTEIITRCARLPLALTLVAAHAAIRPATGLRAMADDLRDTQHRWHTLTGDDPTTNVRAVFSWSYRMLTPDAARLFRLLGLHPGPDITAPAAASLTAKPATAVRPLLTELARAHLITEHTPGRYTLHDLLRAYATDLARTTDPDQRRDAASRRILDHYLHTAYTASRLLEPGRDPISPIPPQPGVTPEAHTDYQQAMAWFTAEHPVLLTAVDHAAATGFDTHTWQLAWTLRIFLDRRGHWQEWAATERAAVAAARRLADPAVQALTHRTLARAYTMLGRFDDAHTHLRHALDAATQAGDQTGQAHTHFNLGYLCWRRDLPTQALGHARQALQLYEVTGHRTGQAGALNDIGWYHTLLGDHQQALVHCEKALALQQELDNRDGQAGTWDSLGHAHHNLGHHTEAVACYRHAVTLYHDLGDRYHEASTLTRLGDTQHTAGNTDAARDAYHRAVTILEDIDHPDALEVRAKLHDLTPT